MACIETRPSETVQVGQGQSDPRYAARKNVKIMKEKVEGIIGAAGDSTDEQPTLPKAVESGVFGLGCT